jgi:UPF0716 protein FxsA
MRFSTGFLIAITLWLGAELLALAAVVHVAGLTGAILIGLLTSLAGFFLLRQVGHGAARHMRRMVNGESLAETVMIDGTLATFGALLLILPGFLSDAIGLGLAAPALRQWVLRRFGGKLGGKFEPGSPESRSQRPNRSTSGSDVLELSPEDWKVVEDEDQKKAEGGKPRSETHPH